jgi:hypothetical protein
MRFISNASVVMKKSGFRPGNQNAPVAMRPEKKSTRFITSAWDVMKIWEPGQGRRIAKRAMDINHKDAMMTLQTRYTLGVDFLS